MTNETATPTAPEIASDLVHQFFVLFKTATVYDLNNEGYKKPAHHARAILKAAQEAHGQLALEVRGNCLFFNKRRVRFHIEGYAGGRFLVDEMTRRRIGAIVIEPYADPSDLDRFVFAFMATETRKGQGIEELRARLREAGVERIKVQVYVRTEDAEAEPQDNEQLAKRAFFRAVDMVQDVMTRARRGEHVNFAQAKRVVHGLVDQVVEDEQALIELSTIHNFDEYTYAHSVNVSVYAITIGVRLGLDRNQLSELGFGALFHDIGKVKLPVELINKPDDYNEFDWAQMRQHPTLGAKTLLTMRRQYDASLARAISMSFEHHLGQDGAGYPRVVNARKPDLFSRICAIADAFDAMTSGRVYVKKPMGPDEALRKMVLRAGTVYDIFLLKLFINAVGVFPIGTLLLLDTHELAVVYRNNSEDLLRPRVRIIADRQGERAQPEVVDLTSRYPGTSNYLRSVRHMVDPQRYGIDIQRFLGTLA